MAINFASLFSSGRWTRQQAESLVALSKAIASDVTPPPVTQAEAEAGTETSIRSWSPERVAQAIAALVDGWVTWSTVTASSNLVANGAIIANSATTTTHTLPAAPTLGDVFVVNAKGAAHRIASNGNVIDGVGSGNDLLVNNGSTAMLVTYAANSLRIV